MVQNPVNVQPRNVGDELKQIQRSRDGLSWAKQEHGGVNGQQR